MAMFAPPGFSTTGSERDGQAHLRVKQRRMGPGGPGKGKGDEDEEEKSGRKHGLGSEIETHKRSKHGGLTVRDIFSSNITPVSVCSCVAACADAQLNAHSVNNLCFRINFKFVTFSDLFVFLSFKFCTVFHHVLCPDCQ